MIKKAFTLAEVLIVIALIGTVAALTLPNLSDSYKADNTIVKLKKFQNELKTAHQQAIAKYGDFDSWYASNVTDNKKKSENRLRIMEFLEAYQSSAVFPIATYNGDDYLKANLKDGSVISSVCDVNGNCDFYIATEGIKSNTLGKNIFAFKLIESTGEIIPKGRGTDRGSGNALSLEDDNLNGTNWAVTIENLDYLKCANSLNWETKINCD